MNYDRLKELYTQKEYKLIDVKPGQFVEVHEKVWDRIWKLKGLVISVKKPNLADGSFTIRWISAWNNIEKTYPLSFPNFENFVILDEYKIRRAKLYYIREKVGKDAKFKSKRLVKKTQVEKN